MSREMAVLIITGIFDAAILYLAMRADKASGLTRFINLGIQAILLSAFSWMVVGWLIPDFVWGDVLELGTIFLVALAVAYNLLWFVAESIWSGIKASGSRRTPVKSAPVPSENVSVRQAPAPSSTQPHPVTGPVRPTRHRTIFISYRRSDSQDVAGRIYDALVYAFGTESVFKDVDAIRPGEDFRVAINSFLNQCDVVLVLIGGSWVDARSPNGSRRLDDPGDFVRIEIETALRRNISVIPVLVQNARMPSKKALPRSLHQLLFNNAVEIRPDPDFHRDMERLVSALIQVR